MKPKTHQFVVTVEIPPGVTVAEMEEYIEESVGCWKGCKDPESPIFDFKGESVKVARLSRSAPGRVLAMAAARVREGLGNGSLGAGWRAVLHKLSPGGVMSQSGYVHLEGCTIRRETEYAILVVYDGGELWLPKSQVADADDYGVGDTDVALSVTEWIARQEGIEVE